MSVSGTTIRNAPLSEMIPNSCFGFSSSGRWCSTKATAHRKYSRRYAFATKMSVLPMVVMPPIIRDSALPHGGRIRRSSWVVSTVRRDFKCAFKLSVFVDVNATAKIR